MYSDPWGENEFVVDGWCMCNDARFIQDKAHRHMGKSGWLRLKAKEDNLAIFQYIPDHISMSTELVFNVNDAGDKEALTLFLLGMKSKYGEEAVRW